MGMIAIKRPPCRDGRECFAKSKTFDENGIFRADICTVLMKTYEDGLCPFCKKKRTDARGSAMLVLDRNDARKCQAAKRRVSKRMEVKLDFIRRKPA